MTRRFLLGVLAMGYSRAVIAAIQLLLVPTLALTWGLPLYGQWLMLASVPVFLGASDFGFSTTAGMQLIGEVARGEADEALSTFRSARRMVLLLTGAMLAVALAVIAILPARVLAVSGGMAGNEARSVLAVLAGYGLLTLQGALFAASARSMGRTAQAVAIEATMQLVEGLSAILLALGGARPLWIAVGYLLIRGCGISALAAYAYRVAPWLHGSARASRARTRAMWRPALAAMALPLSQAGYLQGSALAVGAAGGAPLVPLYTSVRTLSRLGLQVTLMIALPLMPEYTAARARGDDRRSALIVSGLMVTSVLLGVACGLVIMLLGGTLIAAWTHGAIHPPPTMIALMGLAAAMAIVWGPLSDLLLAVNRHEAFAYVYAALALGAVALTFMLVRSWSVTGAAVAGVALEGGMLITVLVSLARDSGPFVAQVRAWREFVPNRY